MNAVMYRLNRHHDVSGVSGEGDEKATVVEFESGLAVLHWNSDKPSIQVHTDVRHIIDHHGHNGASELVLYENERLVKAYNQLMFWMLKARDDDRPMSVEPHPDWPDRLLCMFRDEKTWRMWLALLDGSTYTATHVADGNDIKHTWISPDGGIWLTYTTPADDEDPLAIFDREDR